MTDSKTEPLSTAIEVAKIFPLTWREILEQESVNLILETALLNEQLLTSFANLEENRLDQSDKGSSEDTHLNILENKINMLTQLMQYYLSLNCKLPAGKMVHLNSAGLAWQERDNPKVDIGKILLVEVFINTSFPRPIELLCRLDDIEKKDLSYFMYCSFFKINDVVLDLLEKFIFRHHRREIAIKNTTKPGG